MPAKRCRKHCAEFGLLNVHSASSQGPVFIKQLKSNLYVSLTTYGSFRCYLYSHWLSIKMNLGFFMNMGSETDLALF